jgi:2-haloacid dehalogenase
MNGTLIHFRINDAIRRVLGDRLPAEIADEFLRAGNEYRIDECMGEWTPFHEIVAHSLERTMRRFGLEYRDDDARAVYDEIPTWGPYPGVTEALKRLAESYPLVIITNSDDAFASRLVDNLQAPFDVVITAVGVYKPRLRAFEYMLDKLGVAPEKIVHVSASPKYDLRRGRHGHQAQGLHGPRLRARRAVARLRADHRHRRPPRRSRPPASLTPRARATSDALYGRQTTKEAAG